MPNIEQARQEQYASVLRKLCTSRAILPNSHMLSEGFEMLSERPHAGGRFADVWIGRSGGRRVVVKILNEYAKDGPGRVKKVIPQNI